jgi:hypothetical protein
LTARAKTRPQEFNTEVTENTGGTEKSEEAKGEKEKREKEKREKEKREKDNAEAQRALRFAEEGEC